MAMGFMAGPDRPPILLASIGLWVSVSIVMARMVLMAVIASAPLLTAVLAISVMSVTLGVSFTMTGFFVALLTCFTICWTSFGFCPISEPVFFTWGHDMFSSMASAPAFVRVCAVWVYSCGVNPIMLAIMGACGGCLLSCCISFAK